MNWIKRLFTKKTKGVHAVLDTACVCELNARGEQVGGWCQKHRTDWI